MTAVKVFGIGCASCRRTLALVEDVIREAGLAIAVEKVEDPRQFVTYGVMRAPAVVIDGRLVHAGGVPSRARVAGWLREAATT